MQIKIMLTTIKAMYSHNKRMYAKLVGGVTTHKIADNCTEFHNTFVNKLIANLNESDVNQRQRITVEKLSDGSFVVTHGILQHKIILERIIDDKYANVFASAFYFLINSNSIQTRINIFIQKNEYGCTMHTYHDNAVLGHGSYGTVYQGFVVFGENQMKLTAIKLMDLRQNNRDDIIAEYLIISHFTENQCKKFICLIDEFCYFPKNETSELFSILDKHYVNASPNNITAVFVYDYDRTPIIDNIEVTTMSKLYAFPSVFAQLINTCIQYINELHAAQIVHRDIKPENIIIYEDGGIHPKIIDMGLSCKKCNVVVSANTLHKRPPPRCSPDDIKGSIHYLFPLIKLATSDVRKIWTLWMMSDMWALFIMTIMCVCNYNVLHLFNIANKIDPTINIPVANEFSILYNLKEIVRIMIASPVDFVTKFIDELKFKNGIWKDTDEFYLWMNTEEQGFLRLTELILVYFVSYCRDPTYEAGGVCLLKIKELLNALTNYISDHAINKLPSEPPEYIADSVIALTAASPTPVAPLSLTAVAPSITFTSHNTAESPSSTVGPQTPQITLPTNTQLEQHDRLTRSPSDEDVVNIGMLLVA